MRRLEDWIEYMEGEGNPHQMGQLNLLLKHSLADQQVLDNLRRLRKWLKWTDPCEEIEYVLDDKKFEKNFHKRIMNEIVEKPTQLRLSK